MDFTENEYITKEEYQLDGVQKLCKKKNYEFVRTLPGSFGRGCSFIAKNDKGYFVISFNRREDWDDDMFPYPNMHKNKEVFDLAASYVKEFAVIETNTTCTKAVWALSSSFVDGGVNIYGQRIMKLNNPNDHIYSI